MKTTDRRRLRLRAELALQDIRHRELAARLRAAGHQVEGDDISRIIAGRWDPPAELREAIASMLGRPTFELFQ